MLLSMSLAAAPLWRTIARMRQGGIARCGEQQGGLAVSQKKPRQPENAVIESELQDLSQPGAKPDAGARSPARVLKAQQLKMEALEETARHAFRARELCSWGTGGNL